MDEQMKQERHGHPRFYAILEGLAKLHSDKNHDYAKGGAPLGNFERRANLYSMYPGLDLSDPTVVALVDLMKQLDAALWIKSSKHIPKVEGVTGRMRDVSVYSLISIILEEERAGFVSHPHHSELDVENKEKAESFLEEDEDEELKRAGE